MKNQADNNPEQLVSRKEAIRKAGKYAAFTAAAAIVLLVPKEAQALSTTPPGLGDGYRESGYSPPVGGSNNSPFTKPENSGSKSGLRDSPWK